MKNGDFLASRSPLIPLWLFSVWFFDLWTFIRQKILNFITETSEVTTLFTECLATEIMETYKYLAGISEEQEKQCLQKWRQNSDFWHFLITNISKLCHRIIIIFFLSNMQFGSFWLSLYLFHLHFFTIVIIHSLNPSFILKSPVLWIIMAAVLNKLLVY